MREVRRRRYLIDFSLKNFKNLSCSVTVEKILGALKSKCECLIDDGFLVHSGPETEPDFFWVHDWSYERVKDLILLEP